MTSDGVCLCYRRPPILATHGVDATRASVALSVPHFAQANRTPNKNRSPFLSQRRESRILSRGVISRKQKLWGLENAPRNMIKGSHRAEKEGAHKRPYLGTSQGGGCTR